MAALVLAVLACKDAAAQRNTVSGETTFVTYEGESVLTFEMPGYGDDSNGGVFYQENDWRLFWPEKVNGKKSVVLSEALANDLIPTNGDVTLKSRAGYTASGIVAELQKYVCYTDVENVRQVKKMATENMEPSQMNTCRKILNLKSNNGRVFVFEMMHSSYLAGAMHGMYGFTYVSYDAKLDKVLRLTDIVTDTVRLQKVATQSLLNANNVETMEQLVEKTGYFIYEPLLPLPSAFYFDGATLHFVYQPYEIASYADGKLDFEIPTYMLEEAGIMTEYAQKMSEI